MSVQAIYENKQEKQETNIWNYEYGMESGGGSGSEVPYISRK